MRHPTATLLVLAFLTAQAGAQDGAGAGADSAFLKVTQAKVEDPKLEVSRPSDSWQFVDLNKVKTKLSREGRSLAGYVTLKFQLWYGAARATIFVRAWKLPSKPDDKQPADKVQAKARIKELRGILKGAKVSKRKRVKVGKRAGIYFEVNGKGLKPGKTDERQEVSIYHAVCYRPEDMALFMATLEFNNPKGSTAKHLAKEFKAFVKKVKF